MCPLFVCVGEISGRQESLSAALPLFLVVHSGFAAFISASSCLSVCCCDLSASPLLCLCALNSSDPAMFVFVFMLNERAGASARNPTNLHSLSLPLSFWLVVYIYVCIRESAALANQTTAAAGGGQEGSMQAAAQKRTASLFSANHPHTHTQS